MRSGLEAHISALEGDGPASLLPETQSHGPAQAQQGPVGGPDPGVARGTPRDAQVSCLPFRRAFSGTAGSSSSQVSVWSSCLVKSKADEWASLGEKKI